MPKYYAYMIAGYYLYFTSKCIVEAFHVHARDSELTEKGPAKLSVREDGSTVVQERGTLTDREVRKARGFIKKSYRDEAMCHTWVSHLVTDW